MDYKYNDIYEDEPINRREEIIEEECPPMIKKIRLLEKSIDIYDQPKETIFYLQGKTLEDYEDDYIYNEEVFHYYPTYQIFTDKELRGYFTWRTKLRNGYIEKTSLTYAFLYIYELLNQIGTENALDGYNKIRLFKEEYEKLDSTISRYLSRWINDYVIYNDLDSSYLIDSKEKDYDNDLLVLLKLSEAKPKDILNTLNNLSSYKIFDSPFYKKNIELCNTLFVNCFKRLSEYYDNHHRYTLVHDYFGFSENRPVYLFMNCVFHHNMKKNCVYKVNEIRCYRCEDGYWSIDGYSTYNSPSKRLGLMLKTIDHVLRERYNFTRTIKKGLEFKWVDKIINEEIDNYQKNHKTIEKVTIDYSRLSSIRKDSDITRDKLIVDDELDLQEEDTTNNEPESEVNQFNLTSDEYLFLKCLLYHLDYKWINDKGLMISVLIDSINEKLFDTFLDTVISDDKVEVLDDYIDDLKGMYE